MLTYESLRKFVTEEREGNEMVSLPKDFFLQAQVYIESKQKIGKNTDMTTKNDISKSPESLSLIHI